MTLRIRPLFDSVARRVVLLFVICALLPIIALSVVSSRFVTNQLQAQSQHQQHLTVRSLGMEILGRLALAESEMRLVATSLRIGSGSPNATPQTVLGDAFRERFNAFALIDDSSAMTPLLESLSVLPELSKADHEHLAKGGVHVSTPIGEDGIPRVLLSKRIQGTSGRTRILVGEMRSTYLWGVSGGVTLPASTELTVLGPAKNVMFNSLGPKAIPSNEVLGPLHRAPSGDIVWQHAETEYLGRYWTLFLDARYGSPGWVAIVSVPREDVLAPLSRFTRLLPQVSLLCLAVVLLLSFVQIRRTLGPLVSLKKGTQDIARGDFDTRVTIRSGDEFEQLADSFNSMATNLGRHFNTLATLADIDRAILSTVKEKEIVRVVLDRIPGYLACRDVAVTVIAGGHSQAARLYSRSDPGSDEPTIEKIRLTLEERRFLSSAGEKPLALPAPQLPPHLEHLAQTGLEHFLLLPVSIREVLTGCITLGYRDAPDLSEEDLVEARRLANQVAVALSNSHLFGDLERLNWETLHALARAVDANSAWTAGHSERVTAMAVNLARRFKLPEDELKIIQRGGLLHDIGKIGVPTHVLDKPGKLLPEEQELMRAHVVIGVRILEPISSYSREIPLVLYHHERFDGQGYPEGLAGEEIPFHARILAVADVFDALTSDRPYRSGWKREDVIDFIQISSGTHFDPAVVTVFMKMIDADGQRESATGVEQCAV